MTAVLTHDAELRAKSALIKSPIFALRELKVAQAGETLLLQGRVKSFYQKQLAQEAVRSVAGTLQVVNAIEVD
jgi:osmotically-inducible protein OsmY